MRTACRARLPIQQRSAELRLPHASPQGERVHQILCARAGRLWVPKECAAPPAVNRAPAHRTRTPYRRAGVIPGPEPCSRAPYRNLVAGPPRIIPSPTALPRAQVQTREVVVLLACRGAEAPKLQPLRA